MEIQLHRTKLEKIIDGNLLYKCFRILKVDKARLQVFWGWDFKNTLKNCLKQFNSSMDSWETAVADRPLWLTALGNRMALFKWKQFILSNTQRQTCRAKVLKVRVQPTRYIYVLMKMLHVVAEWIWKFLREYFLGQEAAWLPLGLRLADWGQNHGGVRQLESQVEDTYS